MATEFKIFKQTGAAAQPPAVEYGNIVILKNGSFWTVNELNQMVKIGPFDETALNSHLGDTIIHVTQDDKDRWDNVEMAIVFDTVADMETWVAIPANIVKLPIGFNFFIRDLDAPDYWWDGEEPVEASTAKVDLTEYLKTADAEDMFVAKQAGYRLMSDTEGTKLDGIAAGAQVNVIEIIKVNGAALTPDTNKAVDVIVPTLEVIDF